MEFSKELIEVFEYLGEKAGVAIDWSSENVVPYITELCGKYIDWEIATSVAWFVMALILLIATIVLAKWGWKKATDRYDEELWKIAIVVCVWLITIVVVSVSGTQVMDILKCKFFPELQIYEFVTETAAKLK